MCSYYLSLFSYYSIVDYIPMLYFLWLADFIIGNLYLFIAFTYITHPPTSSPLGTNSVFFVFVNLLLFCYSIRFVF